jgi:hypothetical protein
MRTDHTHLKPTMHSCEHTILWSVKFPMLPPVIRTKLVCSSCCECTSKVLKVIRTQHNTLSQFWKQFSPYKQYQLLWRFSQMIVQNEYCLKCFSYINNRMLFLCCVQYTHSLEMWNVSSSLSFELLGIFAGRQRFLYNFFRKVPILYYTYILKTVYSLFFSYVLFFHVFYIVSHTQ